MSTIIPKSTVGTPGSDEIDLAESVAGEEDPGASIDVGSAGATASGSGQQTGPSPPMSPGDEAPAGTPGTGEDVCPDCGGSGQRDGRECRTCQGTGKVTVGIGGA
jgi:DnaJ-class molecular chaperone